MHSQKYTTSSNMRKLLHAPLLMLGITLQSCDFTAPARTRAPADSAAGEVAFDLKGPNEATPSPR